MAGICGFVSFHGEPVESRRAEAMVAAMDRRGPDRREIVTREAACLGVAVLEAPHRRCGPALATSPGGSVWAVLDGFLSNGAALRRELESRGQRFEKLSDAELLARLYEEYGEDVPTRVEGMFSAAVWDERERRLLLIRDRFGTKPLYYFQSARGLAFGSVIAALRAYGAAAEINLQAVDDYLTLGYVPAPDSIYQGVQKLPAAHHLTATSNGEIRARRYWDPLDAGDRERGSAGESKTHGEIIWDLLTDSVRRSSPEQGEAGVFLSGGPDSAALVAALGEIHGRPFRTFTIGFTDASFDESPLARLTAERYQTTHQELLLGANDGLALPECAAVFDEPYAHPSAVPIYLASKMAARQVSVMLGGDGADVLFGGASTYYASNLLNSYRKLPGWLSRGLVPWAVRRLPVSHTRASFEYLAKRFVAAAELSYQQAHLKWMEIFSDAAKARLYGSRLAERERLSPFRFYEQHFERASALPRLNQLMYVDLNLFLTDDILTKVDRLSAAHGLEVRTPYLDHRLLEYCFRLPPELKVRGRQRKYLFRQLLEGKLPSEILAQKKLGFISPASQWLCGGLRELVRDTLTEPALRRSGLLDARQVQRLIDEHLSMRHDHGRQLWSLLALTLWCQHNNC